MSNTAAAAKPAETETKTPKTPAEIKADLEATLADLSKTSTTKATDPAQERREELETEVTGIIAEFTAQLTEALSDDDGLILDPALAGKAFGSVKRAKSGFTKAVRAIEDEKLV